MSPKVSALVEKGNQLTNGTDYFLPVAADLPDIVVEHVETPWSHASLGAKGAGSAQPAPL